MCNFICVENIKLLIDCIVLKHLSKSTATSSATTDGKNNPSLEDIANPHVNMFKQLWKVCDNNNNIKLEQGGGEGGGLFHSNVNVINGNHDGLLMNGQGRSILDKKGLEDQVSTVMTCKGFCIYYMKLSLPIPLCSANYARRTRKSPTSMRMIVLQS